MTPVSCVPHGRMCNSMIAAATAIVQYLISYCCNCSWFNNKGKAARRKLEWEESLEHDSRKDQFFRCLSPEDQQAYVASHGP